VGYFINTFRLDLQKTQMTWWEVNAHLFFFLISSIFTKKYEKFNLKNANSQDLIVAESCSVIAAQFKPCSSVESLYLQD